MEVETRTETAEQKQSLWEMFLSDAAKATSTHSAATIIVCGEKDNPFAEIIHSMKSSSSKLARPEQQLPYFLNYRYVEADSAIDEALHLHTWTVQDITHFEQIPTIVPENHIAEGKLVYIMCIDTAKPSTIKMQFQKWTAFISKAQELVFKKVGEKKVQELKDALSRRIQFFQLSGAEEHLLDDDEKEAVQVTADKPTMNVGAQIIVLVCNSERFGKNYPQSQAAANKMFARALIFLRTMSLEIGAAIFTFASRRQGTNIKQYIDSIILGQKLAQEPQVENISLQELKEDQIFLPAGFDSEKLLANSGLAKQKKTFDDVFPSKQSKKARKKYEYKQESDSDDNHFLRKLSFELMKAKQKLDKMDKRGAAPQMNLPSNVKKFMNEQLQIDSARMPNVRRRSMTHRKSKRSGRGIDLTRTSDRERLNRYNDPFKALGLIKPG